MVSCRFSGSNFVSSVDMFDKAIEHCDCKRCWLVEAFSTCTFRKYICDAERLGSKRPQNDGNFESPNDYWYGMLLLVHLLVCFAAALLRSLFAVFILIRWLFAGDNPSATAACADFSVLDAVYYKLYEFFIILVAPPTSVFCFTS